MINVSLQQTIGHGYADYWKTTKRYRVCKGSRGSKKSKTTALNMIWRLYQYPEANGLCIRRFANTLRDSVFADLKWAINKLHLTPFFDCTTSPMEITRRSTGQKILFRGLDDGLKITSISVEKGCLCFVWIEEAYEIAEEDFDKVDLSIRGEVPEGYFKQITLTFNPWSETSWLKKRFFDKPDDDTFTKTTTWQCNEWLDDADRKVFEKMQRDNPRRYRIEGEGEWGVAEGLILPNHRMQMFDVEAVKRIPGIRECFGLDFGYTDPNAFICALVDNNAKKIYVPYEWYGTNCTNQQIAAHITAMGFGSRKIVCDCAEPKSIAELCDAGIDAVPSRKGRDSVLHGLQLLQNYQIIVHPRCTEFYKAIENYAWKKDPRTGKSLEEPDHEFSHGIDALRYGASETLKPDAFSFE